MEEDINISHTGLKNQLEKRLKAAIDIAEERLEYEAAHNPQLVKALSLVREFIKERGRVCYGGTAMNMILPVASRFYNVDLDLPDYDFFSPDIEKDVKDIVAKLKGEGFGSVFHKIGIHEGTSKILVNFTPVADITSINSSLYSILHKRAYVVEKIHYTDPDILRMMMYLELSRPRGMVSRWEKVYQRLQLINKNFPPKVKLVKGTRRVKLLVASPIQTLAINYCLDKERVIFTGPLEQFYRRIMNGKRDIFNLEMMKGVVGILSPDVRADAEAIKKYLGDKGVELQFQKGKGEFVPEYAEVSYNSVPVIILLQEVSCNSFLSFNTQDGRQIRIASLDTLITIWYAISIFTKNMKKRIPGIERTIPKFIELVEGNRSAKRPYLPPFSLNCQGYQKGYPTLLREKMLRKTRIEADE